MRKSTAGVFLVAVGQPLLRDLDTLICDDIPVAYSVGHGQDEGGEPSLKGTCVSCGMTDAELNEEGECEDCASGASDQAEKE